MCLVNTDEKIRGAREKAKYETSFTSPVRYTESIKTTFYTSLAGSSSLASPAELSAPRENGRWPRGHATRTPSGAGKPSGRCLFQPGFALTGCFTPAATRGEG